MQKFKIWLLVFLNWLFVFGTPIASGYVLLLAEEPTFVTGFLYIVLAIVASIFAKKISNAIKNMKASYTKSIFKLALSSILLYVVWVFVSYVGVNFNEIAKLLLLTIAGRLVGFVFEMIAIKIDASYVEEIGVI
jgi:hypothetical protein